jgi:adenylate cyclase
MVDLGPVIEWLIGDAPTDAGELVDELATRLVAAGVPLARLRTGVPQLHPEMASKGVVWVAGAPTKVFSSSYDLVRKNREIAVATGSGTPIHHIMDGAIEVRRRLTPEVLGEFGMLKELLDQGLTDYLIHALPCRTATVTIPTGFAAYSTARAGGFTDEEIGALRGVRRLFALRMELAAARNAARELLEVYLGRNASRRILAGAFKRGGGEQIAAVIWFCDLRGFTALADQRPVADVVKVLDEHFDRIAKPVTAHGGEILKFVGDAMLAIFPVGDDAPAACRHALAAATEALDAVATSELRVGIALHLGEVMYGNIGASDRLDFTVIGRAVNEVCRAEALCKETGAPLLATQAFARSFSDGELVSLGSFELRGVEGRVPLHTLPRYRTVG